MRYQEKENFNQYWFSENTIKALLEEIEILVRDNDLKIACVSTPSVYFSLPERTRKMAKVFDIDTGFARDPGFVFFDFNALESVSQDFYSFFDLVVIDPPFITREVWEKYTRAIRLIGKDNAKIILSSISENAAMLEELLRVRPCLFKPSIPHLVYQYNFYTNYEAVVLNQVNPEIPE
jgi:16S rRNA G966 N2-methylase RsmD